MEATEPQSDGSWTSEDDSGGFLFNYYETLGQFLEDGQSASLITDNLSSRQRRQIHAIAHLKKLSHMSLGSGKHEKILVTEPALHIATGHSGRWNPGRLCIAGGTIDPRIIAIKGTTYTGVQLHEVDCANACRELLRKNNLPSPDAIQAVDSSTILTATYPIHVRALFSDPCDATLVVRTIQSCNGFAAGCFFENCDYPIFKDCSWDPDGPVPNFSLAPCIEMFEALTMNFSKATRASKKGEVNHHPFTGTLRPRSGNHSSGYESFESHETRDSFMPSDYGSEVSTSKRKRQTYQEGGYPCGWCGKPFNLAGERTKHEQIHNPIRPYRCKECGFGFIYPKDLRRHGTRTGHAIDDDTEENEAVAPARID